MSKARFAVAVCFVLLAAHAATAAQCVNKFVGRTEGSRQIVTLLTGKLTFQEAQDYAKNGAPIEWLDDKGRTIAKQFGPLKVVRPMPVACDGKPSGVVVVATFATGVKPAKKMNVKIKDETVAFEEQAN